MKKFLNIITYIIFISTIIVSIIVKDKRIFHIIAAIITVVRIWSLNSNNRKVIGITGVLNMTSELLIYFVIFNLLLIVSNFYGLLMSIIVLFWPNLTRTPFQVKLESIIVIIISVIIYLLFSKEKDIAIFITSFIMLVLLNLGMYLITVNKSYEIPYILGHGCMIIIGILSNDLILVFMGLCWSWALSVNYINNKNKDKLNIE